MVTLSVCVSVCVCVHLAPALHLLWGPEDRALQAAGGA